MTAVASDSRKGTGVLFLSTLVTCRFPHCVYPAYNFARSFQVRNLTYADIVELVSLLLLALSSHAFRLFRPAPTHPFSALSLNPTALIGLALVIIFHRTVGDARAWSARDCHCRCTGSCG